LESALIVALLLFAVPGRAQAPAEQTLNNQRVEALAADGTSVDVVSGAQDSYKAYAHLLVSDASLQARVKQLHRGDLMSLTYTLDAQARQQLRLFSLDTASPAPAVRTRVWVLLVCAGVSFLLYYLLSGLHPLGLIVGEDGRYSNSKFQIALWFGVLITTYLAAIWLRVWYAGADFLGGVNIPQNLLLISGMSAFTFAAAKGITTSKVEAAKAKGIADPKNSTSVQPSLLRDLTHNDGAAGDGTQPRLDLGDFQMLVVTLIAVAIYIGLVFNSLGTIEKAASVSLPDVDTTLLAAFGLGHGAYLTKKAVGNVGET
jgi:hypothetical protein